MNRGRREEFRVSEFKNYDYAVRRVGTKELEKENSHDIYYRFSDNIGFRIVVFAAGRFDGKGPLLREATRSEG